MKMETRVCDWLPAGVNKLIQMAHTSPHGPETTSDWLWAGQVMTKKTMTHLNQTLHFCCSLVSDKSLVP